MHLFWVIGLVQLFWYLKKAKKITEYLCDNDDELEIAFYEL